MRDWFRDIAQDSRHATRSLVRSPAYALATLCTLTIGISVAVIAFALVNSVLLRPLPYADPSRLVGAWHDMPPINLIHGGQSVTTYFLYRNQARTIDGIGLYKETSANVAVVGQTTDPQRLQLARCSATLFTVLGVRPLVGRTFSEGDDASGAQPVAVVSEAMWRAQLGSDAHIVGRRIEVDGISREIVGVAPHSLAIPSSRTSVWIPVNVDPANPPADAFTWNAIARLKRGISVEEAQRDFARLLPRISEVYPTFVPGVTTQQIMEQTRPRPVLTPLHEDVTRGAAPTLWIVASAAAFLFLVASINVANLTLVRFGARTREMAVRLAMGAGGARVARYCATELALLSGVAGASSLAVAMVGLRALSSTGPANLPRLDEVGLDWRCLSAALVLCGTAVLLGMTIPMLRIRRGLEVTLVRRTATATRPENRARRVLVGAQIAISFAILAAAGLLMRSFERLHAVRLGFDADHVTSLWVSTPASRYRTSDDVVRFYATLLEGAATIPGVSTAGLSSRIPLVPRGLDDNPLYVEGAPATDSKLPPLQLFTTIGGSYLRTLHIPLLSGRPFDEMRVQREGDAIISSRTAQIFWHDSTGLAAIGKRFRVLPTSNWYSVVGVVGDVHDSSLTIPPSPTVYFPQTVYTDSAEKQTRRTMALVLRTTTGDPATVTAAARRLVHALDPSLPVFDARPLSAAVDDSTAGLRFTMMLLGIAALITLLLGAIGLYGVMAYMVALRRREIGTRIALGATPQSVANSILAEGMMITAVGLAVGGVVVAGTARFIRAFLFGVTPFDPLTLAGATVLLVAVAILSCWLPARRSAATDPAETLRAD